MRLRKTKAQHQLAELLKAGPLLAPGGENVYLEVARGTIWLPVLPSVLKLLELDGKSLIKALAALPRDSAIAYARG